MAERESDIAGRSPTGHSDTEHTPECYRYQEENAPGGHGPCVCGAAYGRRQVDVTEATRLRQIATSGERS